MYDVSSVTIEMAVGLSLGQYKASKLGSRNSGWVPDRLLKEGAEPRKQREKLEAIFLSGCTCFLYPAQNNQELQEDNVHSIVCSQQFANLAAEVQSKDYFQG